MAKKRSYRLEIIRLIAQGLSNDEIVQSLGCSKYYPGQVRKKWQLMGQEERKELLGRAVFQEDPAAGPGGSPGREPEGMKTPSKAARGRYYISRY